MLCTMADIHDGRYLLKKAIKLKGIEKLAYIEGHRIFGIYSNRTCDFTKNWLITNNDPCQAWLVTLQVLP